MNRKSVFRIGMSVLFIALFGLSWAVRTKSRSAVANEQYLAHLPIVTAPLCDFSDYKAGDFIESEPNGTLSEANGPVPPHVTAHGCFSNPSDTDDAYYFYLTERSDIEVNLTDIPAGHNYELRLYFVDQIVIAESRNPGNQDEHIFLADQPRGKYYVQIYNASQTVSKETYKLTLNYTVINECDHLAVIGEIFPQLKDEPGTFPFLAKNSAFQCQIVLSRLHSELFSLHMEYDAGPEDGYWGVATPMGYDASQYSNICVWVYVETVPQSFTINLKDLAGIEKPSPTQSISAANSWQQFCVFLGQYEAEGVDIEQLESVNIHFSQATGDANIWVDDFAFAGTACDHPALTEGVFPQLKDEPGQFPFYSKIAPFQCEASFDPVHSEPVSLHIKYTADNLDGYWGVATPLGYDASDYDAICLWVYGLDPLQSFMVNLRDIAKSEKSSSVQNLIKGNTWTEFCIPLSQYDGVQLDQLENVNIHFSQGSGDVDIWVDDFEFKSRCPSWEFNRDSDNEGWKHNNSLSDFIVKDGVLATDIKAVQPDMTSPDMLSINTNVCTDLEVRYRIDVVDNNEVAMLMWKTTEFPEFGGGRWKEFGIVTDNNWYTATIGLDDNPKWDGTVTQLRYDPVKYATSGRIEIDYIKLLPASAP